MTAYVLSVNDLPTLSGVYLNGDTITLQDGSSWIFHQEQGFSLLGVSSVDAFVRGKIDPVTGGSIFSAGDSGLVADVMVVGGTADDAAEVIAKCALAVSKKAVLRFQPGVTYTFRNVPLPGGLTINATDATIQYGGAYGTYAPLENVKVIAYAEGTVGTPLNPITIIGGTWIGAQIPGNYNNVTAGTEQDAVQFNYVNGVTIREATFKKFQQDAITFSNSPGSSVRGCSFEDICDGAVEFRAGSDYEVSGNVFTRVRQMVVCKPNIARVVVTGNIGSTFRQGIVGHGNDWTITNNVITAYLTPDGIDGNATPGIEWSDYGGLVTPNATANTVISGNIIDGRTTSQGIHLKTPGTAYAVNNVSISDNAITAYRGILVDVGDGVAISGNVIVGGAGGGITANATGVVNVSITGNAVSAENSNASSGVIESASPGVIITGNRVKTASSTAQGVRLSSAAVGAAVTSNTISTTSSTAVYSFAEKSTISGNTIATTAGIAIDANGASNSISGNSLAPVGGEGVKISGARASITGNAIASGTQGVRVNGAGASNSVVSGNTITGCTFWGVNVGSGAVDTIVLGNNLVGNTSGSITDAGTTTLSASNKP